MPWSIASIGVRRNLRIASQSPGNDDRTEIDAAELESYITYMTEMAVSAARDHFADLIDTTRESGRPVYVTRRGRRVAVIVASDDYDKLVEDAEDAVDRAELHAAREEADFVPWDEVKADLGLM